MAQVVRQLGEDTEQLVRGDPYRAMRKGVISFRYTFHVHVMLCVPSEEDEAHHHADGYDSTSFAGASTDVARMLRRLADSLAAQLGTSPGLPSRGAAAISAELQSVARRRGHCYLPWGQLQSAALTMLMQTGAHVPACHCSSRFCLVSSNSVTLCIIDAALLLVNAASSMCWAAMLG
jgi:hypothetical protein